MKAVLPAVARPLLERAAKSARKRRHDGCVAVDQRNIRWCSDGLEIACDPIRHPSESWGLARRLRRLKRRDSSIR